MLVISGENLRKIYHYAEHVLKKYFIEYNLILNKVIELFKAIN